MDYCIVGGSRPSCPYGCAVDFLIGDAYFKRFPGRTAVPARVFSGGTVVVKSIQIGKVRARVCPPAPALSRLNRVRVYSFCRFAIKVSERHAHQLELNSNAVPPYSNEKKHVFTVFNHAILPAKSYERDSGGGCTTVSRIFSFLN